MLDQIINGVWSALWGLALVYAGYALFVFGKILVSSEHEMRLPLWKAVGYIIGASLILAAIASSPHVEYEDRDPLFGGGVITEVQENKIPYKSFAQTFIFSTAMMGVGLYMGKD